MYTYLLIAAIILCAVPCAMAFLFVHKSIYAAISSFSWERSISLEKESFVQRISYDGFPENCRNKRKTQENYQYSATTYKSKMVDRLGKQEWVREPVTEWKWGVRTKYDFEVSEWQHSRTLSSAGNSRDDVHWPDYVMADNERRSSKRERYIVQFTAENGKEYKKRLKEKVWIALDANARYLLKMTLLGNVARIQVAQDGQSTEIELRNVSSGTE